MKILSSCSYLLTISSWILICFIMVSSIRLISSPIENVICSFSRFSFSIIAFMSSSCFLYFSTFSPARFALVSSRTKLWGDGITNSLLHCLDLVVEDFSDFFDLVFFVVSLPFPLRLVRLWLWWHFYFSYIYGRFKRYYIYCYVTIYVEIVLIRGGN